MEGSPDIIDRIREVMKYFGLNQSQMANKTNIRQPNLSAILNRKRSCDEAIVNKICISLDIRKSWLLSGEGSMLNTRELEANAQPITFDYSPALVEVRYFEVSPSATFQEFVSDVSNDATMIGIPAIPGHHIDDSYCVFQVNGDSMAPQIQNKARVLCREINPTKWHTICDRVIVIAYADKFVIKRVIRNELDTLNRLTLASDNPDYPEQHIVAQSDIHCIFQAVRIIDSPIS